MTPAFLIEERLQWDGFLQALRTAWRDLGDSVIAVSLWPGATAPSQAVLMRAIRIVALLNEIVDGGWYAPEERADSPEPALNVVLTTERIHTILLDGLVLLPPDLFVGPPPVTPSGGPFGQGARQRGSDTKELRSETFADTEDEGSTAGQRRRALLRTVEELGSAMRQAGAEMTRLPVIEDLMPWLSDGATDVVRSLSISQTQPFSAAMDEIDRRLAASPGVQLSPVQPRAEAVIARLGGDAGQQAILVDTDLRGRLGDWSVANLARSPIVGDLHVVQQELLRYEAGEIADIENVLANEKKHHTHQFTELHEQETTTTDEHEEEHTHDNQTTDRQEMERETTRESQTQASMQAGVTFSAEYGSMKIGANTQAAYSTSASESNRVASKYAHEVVDHSIDRVKDRRVEQRRVLTRQESVDRNVHKLDNPLEQSVVGIYQWVDKVYEAATFNYGLRMMLDVTVPEPAAYWQYAKILDAVASVNAQPAPPLTLFDPTIGQTRELRASDVDELVTVDELAATFRVAGLKSPPPRWITAGVSFRPDSDPSDDTWTRDVPHMSTKEGKITISKGYAPAWYTGVVNLLSNPAQNKYMKDSGWRNLYSEVSGNGSDGTNLPFWPAFDRDIIGNNTLTVGPFVDALRLGIPNVVSHVFRNAQPDNAVPIGSTGDVGEGGELPVTLLVLGSPTYTATVTVVCERTQQAYRQWQLEQFEAVVTQWEQWTSEFDTAVREAKAAADIKNTPSTSTNTALSGRIIDEELRRQFLEMLAVPYVGSTVGLEEADFSDPKKPQPPALQPGQAAVEGRVVQFVEQAFEWPQMAYFFYPYYWRPEASWPRSMVLQDVDPVFTDFLRAGSARVVVPVRPGFEIAVCHHLGVRPPLPWQAGNPPIVDVEPYLSIAEEIKSSETTLVKPVRIDHPWPVRLPTTLVILHEAADELPVFRLPTASDSTP